MAQRMITRLPPSRHPSTTPPSNRLTLKDINKKPTRTHNHHQIFIDNNTSPIPIHPSCQSDRSFVCFWFHSRSLLSILLLVPKSFQFNVVVLGPLTLYIVASDDVDDFVLVVNSLQLLSNSYRSLSINASHSRFSYSFVICGEDEKRS